MKNIILKTIILSCLMSAISIVVPQTIIGQTKIRIGEAELVIQSPIVVEQNNPSENNGCNNIKFHNAHKNEFSKTFRDFFIGYGLALPIYRTQHMPVYYGDSYNLDIGFKYFYRPVRNYAIGTMLQYTFYNYKLKGSPFGDLFQTAPQTIIKKEYFRTDNIGTGLINRLFLSTSSVRITLDIGGYADFSKGRYKVKCTLDENKYKTKFKDGSIFNPVQAGLYGAIGIGDWSVYARYRLTNFINSAIIIKEPPRLSIGILLTL